MQLQNETIILRDMIEQDIEDIIFWNTKEVEWMDWDAPWMRDKEEDFDWDSYRKNKIVEIQSKKENTNLRMRLEVCLNNDECTHIGSISSYFIDDTFKMNEKGNRIAMGMDIYEKKYRGYGYGKQSYILYLQYLKQKGYTQAFTQTWSGNIALIKMAKSIGFIECNRFKDLRIVNNQKYDALTFIITL